MTAPVILLGPGRSYTTLVAAMLGQHPAHYGLPELNLGLADTVGAWLRISGGGRRPLAHGLLRTLAQVVGGAQTVEQVEAALAWLTANSEMPMEELAALLRAEIAPRALVEKSPLMTTRPVYLQRVLRQFPDARFIHLTRHPRTACDSMLKWQAYASLLRMGGAESYDRRSDPPVFDPQVHWYLTNALVVEMLDTLPPERWRRLRGEDVLEDPARSLGEICDWLGVDTGPEAIADMLHPEASPFAVTGPPNAPLGGDPGFFSSPALRPFSAPDASLAGPLPWRPDGAGLSDAVVAMAQTFGYDDAPGSVSLRRAARGG